MMRDYMKMHGQVTLSIFDVQGNLIEEHKGHNMIVNGGYEACASLLVGATPTADYQPNSIQFGTSDIPTQQTDTVITDPFDVFITSKTNPSFNSAKFEATLGANDHNGKVIKEIGLIRGDGGLFARYLVGSIEKSSSIIIRAEWNIFF